MESEPNPLAAVILEVAEGRFNHILPEGFDGFMMRCLRRACGITESLHIKRRQDNRLDHRLSQGVSQPPLER